VLVEDQALDVSVLLEHLRRALGKREARDDVGHKADLIAEHFGDQGLAVRLVDQTEDGGRMRVIDELVRQERVQQRFYRRVGRRRIDQVGTLKVDHVRVGELVERTQPAQRLELDRRQSARLDRRHVPARALDAQHGMQRADDVPCLGLDRGIAAAVQHQQRVASEQPGRVGAKRDVLADALAGVA